MEPPGHSRREGFRKDPLVMRAYGGMLSIEETSRKAIGTPESVPAAGVVGSKFVGDLVVTA